MKNFMRMAPLPMQASADDTLPTAAKEAAAQLA
jgi:hypothetical protein